MDLNPRVQSIAQVSEDRIIVVHPFCVPCAFQPEHLNGAAVLFPKFSKLLCRMQFVAISMRNEQRQSEIWYGG
jgi:hypothetical protein